MKMTFTFGIGITLKHIARQIILGFKEKNIDLHFEQYLLLLLINQKEEVFQQELAEFMDKDKSSILRQIDALEKKRYVVRMAEPNDRRKNLLTITKKGLEKFYEAENVEKEVISKLTHGITEEELNVFKMVMLKIRNN